jgi:predicted lipoprotein with Yx(FWY)xxD motif
MRSMLKPGLLTLALIAMMPGAAGATTTNGPAKIMRDSDIGRYLATSDGRTLYSYEDDSEHVATCVGECARQWPPFRPIHERDPMATNEEDSWDVIIRPDGSMQWAYHGDPLYTFVQDEAAGIIKGHGVDGEWWVAKP